MGIHGLFPLLSPVGKTIHLTEYKNKRIAVDAFVWMHKAAFRYPVEINKDPEAKFLLPYLMSRVNGLIKCGVKPVIVFDGQLLPSKQKTTDKRRQDRIEALEKATLYENQGNKSEALKYYQRAVTISQESVHTFVHELQKNGVEYIVAPFEADAQLAFLAKSGYVDAVLTEDTDLVAYQCPVTLFKFDDTYHCVQIKFDDVIENLKLTADQFTALCILSGCDYTDHIGKMGVKTALKLLYEKPDAHELIDLIIKNVKFTVPPDYHNQFDQAFTTFKCARAFNPVTQELVFLSDPPQQDVPYLGRSMSSEQLLDLVKGRIAADTLLPFKVVNELPRSNSAPIQDKTPKVIQSSPNSQRSFQGCQRTPMNAPKKKIPKYVVKFDDPKNPQPCITAFFSKVK